MRNRSIFLFVLPALIMLAGCSLLNTNDEQDRPDTLPRSLTSNEQELIKSGNNFSLDIFRNVMAAEKESANVFISPLSISMALGMTLNGAEGTTQSGIKETLGMSRMKLQAINKSYQSLIKLLITLDDEVDIAIGNSIWGDDGFVISQHFKDTLQTYFDARVDELDFDDPAAADVINNWVNDQTNGRISQIVQSPIPSDIVLYLINTIYFKGNWVHQFDPAYTRNAPFYLQDGSSVQVKVNMMRRREMPTAIFSSENVEMAELAYGDSLYKMTILMPANPGTSIDQFVNESLTIANLADWTNQLQARERVVNLPKFESSYDKMLNDILRKMGMDEAFIESNANFSNINSDVQLFISKVKHKANITVNEEGSEAAGATSVGLGPTSAPPSFTVNRPFIYMIRERISGTILFLGVMKNPAL